MERAKCLEEFLPGVGGWWHPEPCERERMCLLFGGKGDNREKRATCWPEFWSSSVFALNWKHTHLSYCQLQAKIDSTSLNPNNKPILTLVNHFSESCITAEDFA